VTSVVCLPDTDPTLDEPGLVEMLKLRARKLSRCRLFPLGALTRGLKGENLTEMAELHEAGCVGYSQAEVPIRDTLVLQRALQYAATFGYTVWLRPQDAWLGRGMAASGAVATRLGLSGVPVSAETVALHTIVELVRTTGARVHLCRLSSAAGVDIVRLAKAQGLPITADVSINSLMLTDVDIGYFNSAMRVVPPLRQGRDRDALQAALRDGTLDALVSDHTPVSEDEKMVPFGEATPGATGLELLLSLALKGAGLVAGPAASLDAGRLRQALATVTEGPVKVLGEAIGSLASSAGRLVQGGVADICVFDPEVSWRVEPGALVSQGKHTPFAYDCTGFELPGRVRTTLVAGQLAHEVEQALI
jgi:dihydroorotase